MAIVNLSTVKNWLGLSTAAEDAMLQIAVNSVDTLVKRYCRQGFEQTTYPGAAEGSPGDAGYYSGDGTRFIYLKQIPVTTLTSIYQDTTGRFNQNPTTPFAAATLLTSGTDYMIHWDGCLPGSSTVCSYSGKIERIGSSWPRMNVYRPGTILPAAGENSGSIKIAYVAGYTTMPTDLIEACCMIVAAMRSMSKKGGPLQSESQGAYSYAMAQEVLNKLPELGSARQVLGTYRRTVV